MEKTIENPEGYETRIEGNKVILEKNESEDEKIRKALIEVFKKKLERGYEWVEYGIPNRSVLNWLEKQKEHPAEWSYVEKMHLANAILAAEKEWGISVKKQEQPLTTEKVVEQCKKFGGDPEVIQPEGELFECPETPIKDAIDVTSRMKYIDEELKPIAEFIIHYASWNLHKNEWNQPVIEVPLFRVLDALTQRGKPYCEG